ncbi:MAG: aromatic hydrocarbon degradation protein [Geobacteraceae bacterium GWC2_55_20]|nr:MAG: aromatic hydrocarbon degradation protein [Geobacteraceae bacterium GWC2_55_20]OGU18999.1 MAG: aromatic hydrocarbon degradation protein [Geobacteraceae bacterium GWF2_54_21]HCE69011.1 aromatic hydrocarbon degradation protein [Geobacter sp.]
MKRKIDHSSVLATAAVLFATICAGTSAHASGFGIFTQGASALGQADAVVAHGDGPSTIFFNPALLNRLPGTQLEVGTTLLFPSRDFKSAASGSTSSTEDTLYYPSTFYFIHTFNDKISAGLGVFNPFGLGTEWNGTWEGRYVATNSQIETYNFNPVLSYQIIPGLSFAAGLDVIYLDASLEGKVNLSAFGLADANQKFKGDGTGFGYNLALAYDAGHGISAGVSYRSEVEVDIDGNINFELPSPLLAGALPNTSAKSKITLPRQLLAGIAYQATDRLTVESGFRWEDWRSYRELKVEFAQPVNGQSSNSTPKNWHDTFAVNVGGKYRLNDTFTLLGGYLYGWNPVPDDTFEPSVPDANTHLFCVGSEIVFDRMKLAVSYAYQLQEERNNNNTVGLGSANGVYNADMHMLGISLAYKF